MQKTLPKLLTKSEVIKALRLDEKGVKNPEDSLRYLIRTRQISHLTVAGQVLFTESAVNDYLSLCMNQQRN